jgi:hypothetical protein
VHLTLESPNAHALGVGDPVKLDERCSPETHSPDLRQAFFWLRVYTAPKQSPRLPTCAPQGYNANRSAKEIKHGIDNNMFKLR